MEGFYEVKSERIVKYLIASKAKAIWQSKIFTIIKRTIQIIFALVAIAIFILGIADVVFFHIYK